MTVREINLSTGEETARNYTAQELAAIEVGKPTIAAIIEAKKVAVRALREQVLDRLAAITAAPSLASAFAKVDA